jgi:hypothetical protein
MSSTAQATSSTSNFQLIINALADYTKITGIDLSKNPFTTALRHSSSPEAILELLQGREKAFKEYRDGNRRLINCLSPAVKVLQAFSGILSGAVGLVSHTCHLVSLLTCPQSRQVPFPPASALLVGFDVLLAVRHLNMLFKRFPYEYARLQVGFRRATMPYSTCLSAWGISLSVWRSIRRSLPLR